MLGPQFMAVTIFHGLYTCPPILRTPFLVSVSAFPVLDPDQYFSLFSSIFPSPFCTSQVCTDDKTSRKPTYLEEWGAWAPGCRGFNPRLLGDVTLKLEQHNTSWRKCAAEEITQLTVSKKVKREGKVLI